MVQYIAIPYGAEMSVSILSMKPTRWMKVKIMAPSTR